MQRSSNFRSFCADIADASLSPLGERDQLLTEDIPQLVTDDEVSEASDNEEGDDPVMSRMQPDQPYDFHVQLPHAANDPGRRVEFEYDDEKEMQQLSPEAELMLVHYRQGHIPFAKLVNMAKRGDLPARLATCRIPKCSACMYCKATRRAWRTKAPVNQMQIPAATSPGAVVGIDQLISSTPGIIGQMKGFLTRKRYTVTTVFVDHCSTYSYTHFQQSTSVLETLEAKKAFERHAKSRGVTIRHYHADNGVFAERGFVDAVHEAGQTISFCAVNAHHQNGRAEKKIRDLQEQARTMILHARQRWPDAITANLWPYAIRMANTITNRAPTLKDGTVSPEELFTRQDARPRVRHSHTFGSPVCVLDARAQAGKRVPKWEHKARIGIYLGESPRHSRKVALVLSLKTGHVSPQFHCQFDDLFDTLRPAVRNPAVISKWQAKTGFTTTTAKTRQSTDDLYDQGTRATVDTLTGQHRDDGYPMLSVVPQVTTLPYDYDADDDNESIVSENGAVDERMESAEEPLPAVTTRSGRLVFCG